MKLTVKQKMPVTAKDIAKELQLSQPTISRILNGDKNHRVSDATRKLVIETARRMGYQPNAIARSLRRGRTNIIGLYTNHNYDARTDFFGTVVGSLQRECEDHNLDLLMHSALKDRNAEEMHSKLVDGRIDGLILHANPDDPLVRMLGNAPLPVVAIADQHFLVPSVTVDDQDGTRQIIEYLWGRGYRKYIYLAPPVVLASVVNRMLTFKEELHKRGISDSDCLVTNINWELPYDAFDLIYKYAPGVAVCCWNDRTAYNLLRYALERGVKVPEEIAVVGFDGFLDDKIPSRSLVTVKCPWDTVAKSALDILLNLVGNNDAGKIPGNVLPVKIIDGDTA